MSRSMCIVPGFTLVILAIGFAGVSWFGIGLEQMEAATIGLPILSLFCLAGASACLIPASRPIALRVVGGSVFLACLGYLIDMIMGDSLWSSSQSITSMVGAIGAFSAFGLPGGYLAITGRYPRWGKYYAAIYSPPTGSTRPILRRRRLIASFLALIAVGCFAAFYPGYQERIITKTIFDAALAIRTNVVEPNMLTAGAPFTLGLKPEWWHDQWLIISTATSGQKLIIIKCFYQHSWLGGRITRIQIDCRWHDPKASSELDAYGVEEDAEGLSLKAVPLSVILGDRPVDLRKWFPGSFDAKHSAGLGPFRRPQNRSAA